MFEKSCQKCRRRISIFEFFENLGFCNRCLKRHPNAFANGMLFGFVLATVIIAGFMIYIQYVLGVK